MLIIITGTPGTGKTEISNELGRTMGIQLVDVRKIVQKNREEKLFFRNKDKELVVDMPKLRKILLKEIGNKKNAIIDSHLACEMKLPAEFVFVLRTDPKILGKRLSKRGYAKKKITENLLCEMLDYCLLKSELNYACKILQVDTTKSRPRNAARRIAMAIRHKKKSLDNVDYSKMLTGR